MCHSIRSIFTVLGIYNFGYNLFKKNIKTLPPVYLHLIFEISSVTRFFFNFKISRLKNQKINLISKLVFAGYRGSKNQVRTRQKIKFELDKKSSLFWNQFFFEFVIISQIDFSKNQAQIDSAHYYLYYWDSSQQLSLISKPLKCTRSNGTT